MEANGQGSNAKEMVEMLNSMIKSTGKEISYLDFNQFFEAENRDDFTVIMDRHSNIVPAYNLVDMGGGGFADDVSRIGVSVVSLIASLFKAATGERLVSKVDERGNLLRFDIRKQEDDVDRTEATSADNG